MKAAAILLSALCLAASPAGAHQEGTAGRLPVVGTAPDFALTDQDGASFVLRDLRGKVVAMTFIYTTCTDTCPLLTEKLASVQKRLGPSFGLQVRFVSITVDPDVDTPGVLRAYARMHGADAAGWSFLTGAPSRIQAVLRDYGAFAIPTGDGSVDHLLFTSLIDRQGRLRVQYLGYRFNPDEMLRDIEALVRE